MEYIMSEDAIKTVESVFGLNNIRTAIIGGTMIGIDSGIGTRSNTNTNISNIALDNLQYLNLFPELTELEHIQGNPFDYMGLSTIWNVGFTTINEKLTSPDFFAGNSSKYLKNRRIRTVDQLFSRRSESSISAFFGCFKLHGATNNIIVDLLKANVSTDLDEFIRYGLICNHWVTNPQTIRYAAAVKGDTKTRDYLYLIGSDKEDFFNPQKIMETIFTLYTENEKLSNPQKGRKISIEVKSFIESLNRVWDEFNINNIPEQTREDNPNITIAFNNRILNRIQHGVFGFYNYLLHVHKHLKLPNIYEVSKNTLGKSVRIEDLIKEYEPIYTYCKNIHFYNNL